MVLTNRQLTEAVGDFNTANGHQTHGSIPDIMQHLPGLNSVLCCKINSKS